MSDVSLTGWMKALDRLCPLRRTGPHQPADGPADAGLSDTRPAHRARAGEGVRRIEACRHSRLEYARCARLSAPRDGTRTTDAMSSSSARTAGRNFLRVQTQPPRERRLRRHTGQSSARRRRTPTRADEFTLAGPSDLPDPRFNAYRKDLADVALANRVVASHYAEPAARRLDAAVTLRASPWSTPARMIGARKLANPFYARR